MNRPTPDISRFLPSKVATAPRNTKPSKPIPAMTARTMSSSARKVPANTQPRAIGNQVRFNYMPSNPDDEFAL